MKRWPKKEIHEIREAAFKKFDLVCMHLYHSLGRVETGQVCLFVFVSSAHRGASYEALRYIVDQLKAKAPIFGKEILEDKSHSWKVNQ